jgi:hypothetical protein
MLDCDEPRPARASAEPCDDMPPAERMLADPPGWLTDLRKHGPHPKNLVAAKLGVSVSGLTRGGITEALTTDAINALLEDKPEWLIAERESYQNVLTEQRRLKSLRAEKG